MNGKTVLEMTLTLLAVGMLSFALSIKPICASPTMVSVDPPVIWDPAMGIGTQFSVDIVVDYVENLWGYQFWLSFNPEVIHGVSVENGPFLGSAGGIVIVAPGVGFDNDVGELKLFGASIFFMGPPPDDIYLPDGGGVLATVTFEVVGIGCSPIALGSETGLMDKHGEWIFYGEGKPGFFANTELAPELYIRRKGAHGVSGVWPEWQVGATDSMQTLYCKVTNWGEVGANVAVEFIVAGPDGVESYMSDPAWVEPLTRVDDETYPGEVTLSVSFTPGIVGKYENMARLYFAAGCMIELAPYEDVEAGLGGVGLSRMIAVGFKVQ